MFIEIILIGLLGILTGMVVNYLADILPIKRRLKKPICIHCGESQSLQNYFLWPRKCYVCGKRRGVRVWTVELFAIFAVYSLWNSPEMKMILGFPLGLIVIIYFGVVVVIDIEHRLILNPVSLFGVFLGIGIGSYLHGITPTLIGGGVGFTIMFLFYGIGVLFSVAAAKIRGESVDEVALGFGDVNLSGVLGLFLGWPNILPSLFLSVLIAGIFSSVYILGMLILSKYRSFAAIPYGPFLISGAILLLFFPSNTQQALEGLAPLFFLGQ